MDFPLLLINSFNKYLLYDYYIPDTLLGYTAVNTVSTFKEFTIWWEDTDHQQAIK